MIKTIGYESRIREGQQFHNKVNADNVKSFILFKNKKSFPHIHTIKDIQLYFDKKNTQIVKCKIQYYDNKL